MVKISPELVLSVLIVLLSIVECGLGGWVCTYITNLRIGGWWGALATFVSGLIAFVAAFRDQSVGFIGRTITGISLVMIVAATLMDGIETGLFISFDACLTNSQLNNGILITYWGPSGSVENNAKSKCGGEYTTNNGEAANNCVCYNNDANTCYGPYNIENGITSCGSIVNTGMYPQRLRVSAILCAAIAIFVSIQLAMQLDLYDRFCSRKSSRSTLSKPLSASASA